MQHWLIFHSNDGLHERGSVLRYMYVANIIIYHYQPHNYWLFISDLMKQWTEENDRQALRTHRDLKHFYHSVYGCMFCMLLFNFVNYVILFFVYVFLLLCMFCSVYSVSLCCSVYCLLCTVLLPPDVNPIAVNKI